MYSIILHDYLTNTTVTLENFNTLENALLYSEEYISDYVKELQGNSNIRYLFDSPSFGNVFKEGCYCKIYKDHFLKFTLINRKREVGYIYNTQEDIKHFDLFISRTCLSKLSKRDEIQTRLNFDQSIFTDNLNLLKNYKGEDRIETCCISKNIFDDCVYELTLCKKETFNNNFVIIENEIV